MVTVLFADLVDSTGLAQRLDPERAREVLGRFFDAATEELQALRGRPEKFIGDAVMAVFGLPHGARGRRAARGAGRARDPRADPAPAPATLGLPSRSRSGSGSSPARRPPASGPPGSCWSPGPVVNAAARLQTAAAPGEVLVGRDHRTRSRETAVSYGERRDVRAKGFDHALDRLPGRGAHARDRPGARSRSSGARASSTILRESLTARERPASPVLVTVLGEPGIGKSRLADELVAGLGDDVPVLSAAARVRTPTPPRSRRSPRSSRELAGIDDGEPAEKTQAAAARAGGPRWRRPGRRRPRSSSGSRCCSGIGRAAATSRRSSQDVQAGFLASGRRARAASEPVVLVFEDAHTLQAADARPDRAARRAGARRGPGGRCPRLGAHRAARRAAHVGHRQRERRACSGSSRSPTTRRSSSRGRPAAAASTTPRPAEIAARGRRQPVLHHRDDRHAAARRATAPGRPRRALPPTVQAVVAARLDALRPRLRELARRASVVLRLVRPGRARRRRPRGHRRRAPAARGRRDRRARGRHGSPWRRVARPPRHAEGRRVREPAQARARPAAPARSPTG